MALIEVEKSGNLMLIMENDEGVRSIQGQRAVSLSGGPLVPIMGRRFAFRRVGKEQPAYSDHGGDGSVPNRTARERAAGDGDDQAGEDTCQQPGKPLGVVG